MSPSARAGKEGTAWGRASGSTSRGASSHYPGEGKGTMMRDKVYKVRDKPEPEASWAFYPVLELYPKGRGPHSLIGSAT